MRYLVLISCSFLLMAFNFEVRSKESNDTSIIVYDDICVYNNGTHAAFTSLEEYKGKLYLAFREAGHHIASSSDKGRIRVLIKSTNGWKTDNVFGIEGVDLRDPHMLKWKDKLLLYTSGYCSELTDKGWKELKKTQHDASHPLYIWKVRAFNDELYGIGNRYDKWPKLLKSNDGINWNVIDEYKLGGYASEADLCFIEDSLFICFRVDNPVGSNSLWGVSIYPFRYTEWRVMDVSIASPEMMADTSGTIYLAGREYAFNREGLEDSINVSLFSVGRGGRIKREEVFETGQFGDKGYPSFAKYKGELYMSYYTGKTDRTQVHLVKIMK